MVEPTKGESVPEDGQRNGHGVIVIFAGATDCVRRHGRLRRRPEAPVDEVHA
jgi:hypothetical protein